MPDDGNNRTDNWARAEIAKLSVLASTTNVRLTSHEESDNLQFRQINDRLTSIDRHLEDVNKTYNRTLFTFLILLLTAGGTLLLEIMTHKGIF